MKKIIYLLSMTLFVLLSCNQEDNIIDLNSKKGKPEKVTICHYNPHNDTWKTIDVNEKQLAKHLEHGDRRAPCGYTYVPDDKFEWDLINLGHDDVLDDYVLTSSINSLTTFRIGGEGCCFGQVYVWDLTGLEDFISLRSLNLNGGTYSSVDLTNMTELTYLGIDPGFITSLDLSKNTMLKELYFPRFLRVNADPTSLNVDLTKNIALTKLDIENGYIVATTDLSQNIALEFLRAEDSPFFESIDLSNNTALTFLEFSYTQLTNLDVSNSKALIELRLRGNNELTFLNVQNGNNASITTFRVQENTLLNCIQVDDETDANAGTGSYGSWFKDVTANYSEDCGY